MMYIRCPSLPTTVLWAFHTIQPSSFQLSIHALVADRQSVQWCADGKFLAIFCVPYFQECYSTADGNVSSHEGTLAPFGKYNWTYASFGPLESTTKTANRSVKSFLRSWWQQVPIKPATDEPGCSAGLPGGANRLSFWHPDYLAGRESRQPTAMDSKSYWRHYCKAESDKSHKTAEIDEQIAFTASSNVPYSTGKSTKEKEIGPECSIIRPREIRLFFIHYFRHFWRTWTHVHVR